MFPRLPYFAETSLLVSANIRDMRPVLSFRPVPDVLATFGWDTLWRVSNSDGLYGSAMVEYANTNKVTGSRVGTELSADVRWRVDRHLAVGAIAAEFLSGPAVQKALGKNVTFFALFATYRFLKGLIHSAAIVLGADTVPAHALSLPMRLVYAADGWGLPRRFASRNDNFPCSAVGCRRPAGNSSSGPTMRTAGTGLRIGLQASGGLREVDRQEVSRG
jgi:hypothetical protein